MLIGEKIKTVRTEAGLSQDALAAELDTSRQTISSWENDKTYPSIQTIVRLSDMFEIPVEALIREDVEKMKEALRKDKEQKIQRNKDREMLNRLNAFRFFGAFTGALTAYPIYNYFGGYWTFIPLALLLSSVILTIPIQIYRNKYDLKKYQDIVAFFDEKYDH